MLYFWLAAHAVLAWERAHGGARFGEYFRIARFRFDRRGRCLYRLDKTGNTVLLPAGRTALDILGLLVEHAGEVVESEEIRKIVWRGKTVEDANLAIQIFNLRENIGRNRIQTPDAAIVLSER